MKNQNKNIDKLFFIRIFLLLSSIWQSISYIIYAICFNNDLWFSRLQLSIISLIGYGILKQLYINKNQIN